MSSLQYLRGERVLSDLKAEPYKVSRRTSQVTFTIDTDLYKEFRVYCDERGLKRSNVIEALIKLFLEEKG